MKIVICKGSEFNFSAKLQDLYMERAGIGAKALDEKFFLAGEAIESRSDPLLVGLVEELGNAADPPNGFLKVLDVPVPPQGVCIRAGGYAQGKYEEYVTENAREWW